MKQPPLRTLTSSEMVAALAAFGFAAVETRRLRRRRSLGRAMHELRRPLQALLLTRPHVDEKLTAVDLALAALRDLEAIVEGGEPSTPLPMPRSWPRLLHDAADRWQLAARLRGGEIAIRCLVEQDAPLPAATVLSLSQALDNLILNALSHGGPTVSVSVSPRHTGVVLEVVDRGRPPPQVPQTNPARHGHGLRVVAAIAAKLGGDFELRREPDHSRATLYLPGLPEGS